MRSCASALAVLCLSAILASAAAAADTAPAAPADMAARMLLPPAAVDRLALTDAQRTRVTQIVNDFAAAQQEALRSLSADVLKARQAMQDAKQQRDRAAYGQAQDRLKELAQTLAQRRSDLEPALLATLTDEQKKRYATLKEDLLRPEAAFGAALGGGGAAQNRPASGRTPGGPASQGDVAALKALPELAGGEYRGFKGGLYPDGKNERPTAHEATGLALSRRVRPLDADGKPAADGKIALLTVGMSNTVQATNGFKQAAAGDKGLNPALVIVNGALGGMTAFRTQDPDDNGSGTKYWTHVDERLKEAGVTRAQVQAVWLKQADAGPTDGFPAYAQRLQAELARIMKVLAGRFPNLRLAYLSGRTFGGFATTPLNPEPYAYESGLSVKWLIEQQIKGDAALAFDSAKGPVASPWLSWGPYLWANGKVAATEALPSTPADFTDRDGTHESPVGQAKVGAALLKFFKTDTTTREWFCGKP